MATVVLLTRVNLKEESTLLLPEMSLPGRSLPEILLPEMLLLEMLLPEILLPKISLAIEGDSFARLISSEPHLRYCNVKKPQLIENLSLDLFVASKNIFGKIGKLPRESWLKHFDILEMKSQVKE